MTSSIKWLLFLILLSTNIIAANGNDKQYVEMEAKVLSIENNHYLAITLNNQDKWHTYWKNPGYAGLPIKIKFFENNQEVNFEELEWPLPQKFIEQEDMLTYGYEGSYSLFFKIDKKDRQLLVHGTWLVCKDICIPGEQKKQIQIKDNKIIKNNAKTSLSELEKRFNSLPKRAKKLDGLNFFFIKVPNEESLMLQYELENFDINQHTKHENIIYPFLTTPLDFRKEELYYDETSKTLYGQIKVQWDGEYEDPAWPLPKDGKLKRNIPIQFLMNTVNGPITFAINLSEFQTNGFEASQLSLKNLTNLELGSKETIKKETKNSSSFYMFFLFAFLGGLILNLMPCVLPVISLKLFGLISHSQESKANILKHNLAYTFGVLVSFLGLAFAVYSLKSTGEEIGWGFQMQSPYFVFFMLVLLFILSLNMMGLFEFRTPGGKTLGSVQVKQGFFNDVLGGIFATILATPCSAPFLGTALTFAFTTSTVNLFVIFLSIGLGLAFPFILTGFFPTLISFFPRPGMWMVKLKYFLGLSLLITFAWLFDVFANLISIEFYGIYFSLFFVFLFFAFFARAKISKTIFSGIVYFSLPVVLFISLINQNAFTPLTNGVKVSIDSDWKVWSEENMNNTGQPTFIDFTAKWCLTCKVNKKIVLDTQDFKEFVHANNIQLMRADWTKRDEHITRFLKSHDIIGVPAYFVKTKSGKVISLGETISLNEIKEAINQ